MHCVHREAAARHRRRHYIFYLLYSTYAHIPLVLPFVPNEGNGVALISIWVYLVRQGNVNVNRTTEEEEAIST